MGVSYDLFTDAFLQKITEFDFINIPELDREATVDGFMKRAIVPFSKNYQYDLVTTADDEEREFNVEIDVSDVDEILDIVSDGMVVQWLKPYLNRQELLENALNTRPDYLSICESAPAAELIDYKLYYGISAHIESKLVEHEAKLPHASDWEAVELTERMGGFTYAKVCLDEAWAKRKE